MRMITRIDEWRDGEWLDHRSHPAVHMREAAEHPVPGNTPSWFHVFGIAAITVFLLQFVADILLALIYLPPASQPWTSLRALNHHVRPAGQTSARDAPRNTLLRAGCQEPPRPHQQDHNR